MRSLPYFQRMMSGRGTDSNVADDSAAQIVSAVGSKPCGNRPTSSRPLTGDETAWTTPGSR